jgi:4-amino-4-deoxy-L-arabinose transferase-like glycosyltransferase
MRQGIDAAFLSNPLFRNMNSVYPPFLPCIYAWATILSGRFAWGAALLSTPLFVVVACLTFFGFARPAVGARRAGACAALLAAILAYVLSTSLAAGNADSLLIYCEVLALSAIAFGTMSPATLLAAGIGLTMAVLTKLEGVAFAGLVIASAFLRRDIGPRKALTWLVPGPLLAFAAWSLLARLRGFADPGMSPVQVKLNFAHLDEIVKGIYREARYGYRFLPWFAVLFAAFGTRTPRDPRRWLLVAAAAGCLAFMVYVYLTSPDSPTHWISWSAGRLLIAPLVCLFVAAVAEGGEASQESTPAVLKF